jgi:type II secretory pathway component GspD/PulD (secretin)
MAGLLCHFLVKTREILKASVGTRSHRFGFGDKRRHKIRAQKSCRLMKFPRGRWRGAVFLGLALGMSLAAPAKAVEPRWREGPYSYLVVDQDLRVVIEQFARNMNLPVRVSEDIATHRLKGKVGAPNAKAFLQWLCDSYQLVWYFDGVTLHVLPQSLLQNSYLELGPVPLDELRQRLAGVGIADERFPFQPTGDLAFVSLAAPQAYTSAVRQVLDAMKSAAEARPLMKADMPGDPIAAQPNVSPSQPAADSRSEPAQCNSCAAPAQPRDASAPAVTQPAPDLAPPVTQVSTAPPNTKTQERLSTTAEKTSAEKGKVLVFRGGRN